MQNGNIFYSKYKTKTKMDRCITTLFQEIHNLKTKLCMNILLYIET